ncbi:hypothetical protein DFH09DRAFT_1316692 [Mycena vulgaris]|nr:hypothetical protein DFH09DRAFT_1316692 [Mycena vulgaris]
MQGTRMRAVRYLVFHAPFISCFYPKEHYETKSSTKTSTEEQRRRLGAEDAVAVLARRTVASTPSKYKAQPSPPFPLSRSCLGRTISGLPGATPSRTAPPPPSASYHPPIDSAEGHHPHRQRTASPRWGSACLAARACPELERTGVATPLVFSALALDMRRAAVTRVVHAFLATCADGAGPREEERWRRRRGLPGRMSYGCVLGGG